MKRVIFIFIMILTCGAVSADARSNALQNMRQDAAPVEVNDSQKTLDSQWNGRKVIFLGDSIIDPRHVGTTVCYWEYLAELMGIDAISYGVSGAQAGDLIRQTERMSAENGDDFDAVIISIGTNDYNNSTPLGEWYRVTGEKVVAYGGVECVRNRRSFVMSHETFRGRLNILMDTLKRKYPLKQIILLTPIHRGYAFFSERNVQPDESYCNAVGLYIDQYAEVIRECRQVWSVPVIDMFSESGLFPLYESNAVYFHNADNDMLHPDANGHYRMARVLQYKLLSMPSGF